jgi:PAS domain S-box-containing protein
MMRQYPNAKKNNQHPSLGRKRSDIEHRLAQCEAVLASIQDGLLVLDKDWRCTYLNEAAAAFLKTPAKELIGRVVWDVFPASRYPRLHDAFTRAAEQKVSVRFEGFSESLGRWYECRCYSTGDGLMVLFHDTTSRKQTEEVLRESREDLNRAQAVARTGSWRMDIQRNVLLWSDETYRIFGLPQRTPMTYDTFLAAVHPDDRQYVDQQWTTALRGEPYDIEHRIVVGDTVKWVRERAELEFDSEGVLRGGFGTVQDITERKQAEEALRESEERYRTLFESSHDGIIFTDMEGQILHTNSCYREMLGYTAEELHALTYQQLTPQRWQEMEAAIVRDQVMTRGYSGEYEKEYIRKDGTVFPVSIQVWLIWDGDGDGRPQGMWGIVRDITERKRAEEALRESEERLRLAQQAGRVGVFDWNLQNNTAVWTPEMEELFGIPVGGFEGNYEGWARRVHPEDLPRVVSLFQEWMPSHRTEEAWQYRFIRNDGQVRWMQAKGRILRDPNGKPLRMIGTNVDITEQQNAEEALRELTKTLEGKVAQRTAKLEYRARQLQKLTLELSEAEDRERKRIAEILHDDLQQILAAAKFHLNLLRSRAKYDPSIQTPAAQIDHMLKDAIDKSRALSHELSPAVLHHGDFGDTLGWLAGQIQAKHGLVVHVDPFSKVELQSDALRAFLYKAAQELLFNVVKHARVNEARIRIRRWGRCICLSVSDQGRGFDLQNLKATAGFGLFSIRERVELLGGRMKIKSIKGKGSTFHIVVPDGVLLGKEISPSPEPDGRVKEGWRGPGKEERRLRVLLADDHEIVREGLLSLLSEAYGIQVVGEAANGREAVDLADRLRPDVVIMDVAMPLIDGDEATRQIKQHLPETRVIALSMYEEHENVEKMLRAGAETYILKTAPSEELLAAVRGKTPSAQ